MLFKQIAQLTGVFCSTLQCSCVLCPHSGRHIELHSYVRTYLRPYIPQILWHQLLLNDEADFFQTCTDDQAGCVDDHKERIFSCDHFYQSYGPLLLQMLLQQWGHQCPRTHSSFVLTIYLNLHIVVQIFLYLDRNRLEIFPNLVKPSLGYSN
jgi:hypothetical protein